MRCLHPALLPLTAVLLFTACAGAAVPPPECRPAQLQPEQARATLRAWSGWAPLQAWTLGPIEAESCGIEPMDRLLVTLQSPTGLAPGQRAYTAHLHLSIRHADHTVHHPSVARGGIATLIHAAQTIRAFETSAIARAFATIPIQRRLISDYGARQGCLRWVSGAAPYLLVWCDGLEAARLPASLIRRIPLLSGLPALPPNVSLLSLRRLSDGYDASWRVGTVPHRAHRDLNGQWRPLP